MTPEGLLFDAAIAGAGPAGAACAAVLARAGWRVLLADASMEHGARIGENLPPSVFHLLAELGLRDAVRADGHRACPGGWSCWGGGRAEASDTLRHLQGDGVQLDRARFDERLRYSAVQAGVQLRPSTHLQIDQPAAGSEPHLLRARPAFGEAERLATRWFIDATGRSATGARRLGARRERHDTLIAFHQRLESAGHGDCDRGRDRDGRTWIEAVEDGWWYSVLLPAGERVVSFLGDADLVDHRALLAGDGLWRKLQAAEHLRALCTSHGYRPAALAQGADACSSELDRAAGHRWLAVGDAALAFDPLSSKGIGNALYTGLCAARAILAHDGGDAQATARYASHLRAIHHAYRTQLAAVYAQERRWAGKPFWARRHARAPSGHEARPSPAAATLA